MKRHALYPTASLLLAAIALLAAAPALAGLTYQDEVLSDNPRGYWRFEEAAGPQAADSSGNLLHGTYTGGVTLGAPGAAGIGGNAAVFDGSTGYVQLPGTWGGTGWPQLTIEAWVNTSAPRPAGFQAVVSADTTSFAHFQLYDTPNPAAQTGAYTNGGFAGVQTASSSITGTWRHLVFVAESGNTRLYEDGLQLGAAVGTVFTQINANSNVSIGRGYAGDRKFKGLIDEVAIYNTALSDQRVMDHYIAGQPEYVRNVVADQPLVYYKLHEAQVGHTSRAGNYGTLGAPMHGTYSIMGGSGGAFTDVPTGYTPPNLGKKLDGTHAHVYVPAAGAFAAAVPQFSVEFWMMPANYNAGPDGIKAIYAANGWDSQKLHLNLVGSNLQLAVNGYGSFPGADLAPFAPIDAWSHVVVTYDALSNPGNNITSFYVNGELIGQETRTGSLFANFNTPGTIGAWNGNTRFFDGALSDVALYGYVLNPNQVYIHFHGIPEPGTGLLALLGAAGLGLALARRRRRCS